jgi:hypothetical protein
LVIEKKVVAQLLSQQLPRRIGPGVPRGDERSDLDLHVLEIAGPFRIPGPAPLPASF